MKNPGAMAGASTTSTVAGPECCSSRCWRDLPKDIIDSILGRLTLLADYDRFGAVCSTWRRASLDPINRNSRIESSLSSYSPLLVLPSDEALQPTQGILPWKCQLIDLFRGNTVVKNLTLPPIPHSSGTFYGSSHGWLIFTGRYSPLTLINPFYTREGRSIYCCGMIRLPPLPYREHYVIGKLVLSADPALSPNDYLVLVICGVGEEVLFIKSGNNKYKNWTSIKGRDLFVHAEDVVFHNGVVYAVDRERRFFICDNIMESTIPSFDLLCVAPPPPDPHETYYKCYIVPSPDDEEIFLVYMSMLLEFQTRQFRVYKLLLSPDGSPASWLEMKNLGNLAIFLGGNHSVYIDIKSCRHGGFQPNSIYFLNDMFHYGGLSMQPKCQDVGIFNLEDQSRKFYERNDLIERGLISPPAWLFPSLPGNWRKQVP